MSQQKRLVLFATFALCGALLLSAAQAATLRWASRGDVQTMDPYSQNEGLTNNFANLIHDLLVERDRNSVIGPRLATSWSIVDDRTWRFVLRKGVRFHDGSPFTADDVVFSIERAQTPPSQLAQYARARGKAVKIDDHTVELRQERPDPLLLEHLNTIYIMAGHGPSPITPRSRSTSRHARRLMRRAMRTAPDRTC